ncbi:MAG: hypothetical protein KAW14_13625 [Candidatus Aegiribacteria sp.]|nr:hypothetical protein [Candidatus Aegiribacteria sp.]
MDIKADEWLSEGNPPSSELSIFELNPPESVAIGQWIFRNPMTSSQSSPFVIRRILKHLDLWEDPRPPPEPLELVCEPDADYIPWQDEVPEIEVG